MRIDLNSDLGEGFGPWRMGDDGAMLDIVTTVNIACGFHAGDPEIMRATAEAARAKGLAVGAHPGFADLANFGRRRVAGLTARETENLIAYQVGAFAAQAALAGIRPTHVKPHGALANVIAEDDALALAVARAVKAVDPTLMLMVMPGMATERAAEKLGLATVREVYADRTYADTFNLTDRALPGAVLHDPAEAVTHVRRILEDGVITSVSGKTLKVVIDTVCVHGDNPAALQMARTLRDALTRAGFTVTPFKMP
jgi:UPF0271 protein